VKQEIVCHPCAAKLRAMFPTAEPYPGETVKFAEGIARDDFVCDQCGEPLDLGQHVVAFSISSTERPYFPWQAAYMLQQKQ